MSTTSQIKVIKWTRAGITSELPLSDDGAFVLLGSIKIPYFEGFSMDDFTYEARIAPSNEEAALVVKKDLNAFDKVIGLGFYTEEKRQSLEQQICHDYANIVKCIRQNVNGRDADIAVAHLKSLRSSYVQKMTVFFDYVLSNPVGSDAKQPVHLQ